MTKRSNPPYSKENLAKTVRRSFTANRDDIACDAAGLEMTRLAATGWDEASFEASLNRIEQRSPQLWQHLQTCADCQGELEMLLVLINRPADDLSYLSLADLSIPPVPGRETSLAKGIRAVLQIIDFPGFVLGSALQTRSGSATLQPLELGLNPHIRLRITPHNNEADPHLRDLFLTLSLKEPVVEEIDFEGYAVSLLNGEDGREINAAAFDQWGDAALLGLEPEERYTLQIGLSEETFSIQNITFKS